MKRITRAQDYVLLALPYLVTHKRRLVPRWSIRSTEGQDTLLAINERHTSLHPNTAALSDPATIVMEDTIGNPDTLD